MERELIESLFVHYPLKADDTKSIEFKNHSKEIKQSVSLWSGGKLGDWRFEGDGTAVINCQGNLCLSTKARSDRWPESEVRSMEVSTGKYATFGSYFAVLKIHNIDTEEYNRISFKIRPECPGTSAPIVRVGFINDGRKKLPDKYSREGYHAISLNNYEWNDCEWEIDSLPHDRITEISFEVHRYGQDTFADTDLYYEITDVFLEKVEPNIVKGWIPGNNKIVYSTTGYTAEGNKTAITRADGEESREEFFVYRKGKKEPVLSKKADIKKNRWGIFGVLDFSEICEEGEYYIKYRGIKTEKFLIGQRVFETTVWKLINFLYCERCGYPVPTKHGICHLDVVGVHNHIEKSFAGGWHDAADVSQQTVQTAEITLSLLEAADRAGSDSVLKSRLLEEAMWGIDFVLRTRFGDGYRMANASIRRWTDNERGNFDDEFADINQRSFENFICSYVEAAASKSMSGVYRELAFRCKTCAEEDFRFAVNRFEQEGVEPAHMEEHTSSASISQYYAAVVLAASELFSVTQRVEYEQYAIKYVQKLILCQEQSGKAGIFGFFYRDETKTAIVHFSHQARDQIFSEALVNMCRVFPCHEERIQWERALEFHGNYLCTLMDYAAPYGMLPAGIYHMSEVDDEETFAVVHPQVKFAERREDYREQLKNGLQLEEGYCIKMFPVWFSFRGNSAIHLSMGISAAIIGKYFKNRKLLQIAREQLYWTLGKNPFGQSLIYGEGQCFGRQYTALLGETVGEIPVGVQTKDNEDEPYWPPACVATYREIWTTPAGKWLRIFAGLGSYEDGEIK